MEFCGNFRPKNTYFSSFITIDKQRKPQISSDEQITATIFFCKYVKDSFIVKKNVPTKTYYICAWEGVKKVDFLGEPLSSDPFALPGNKKTSCLFYLLFLLLYVPFGYALIIGVTQNLQYRKMVLTKKFMGMSIFYISVKIKSTFLKGL